MNNKYLKKLGAFVVALSMGISILPIYATTDEILPISEETEIDTEVEDSESLELDFSANYFADESNSGTNNKYSIHFTALEDVPAFKELIVSFTINNARVDNINFDSSLSGSVRRSSEEENSIVNQTIAITADSTISVANKSKLLVLDIISSSALTSQQLNEIISVTDFTIKKEDESTETYTLNYTMNEGPIIPALDANAQGIYDAIITLPTVDSLSFYNEDNSLKDIDALYNSINDISLAFQASDKKNDIDTVLEFYGYSSTIIADLLTAVSGMKNYNGLIEIYNAIKDLEENKLINYQFIFAVYNNKKDGISITDIPESSSAYTQIQTFISTIEGLDDTLGTILSSSEYLAKIYACEDALYVLRGLSDHIYYSDYITALETQINALITDIETNYSERNKDDLLNRIKGYKNDLNFFKQGISDIPTMTVEIIKTNITNNVTFKRKSKLSSTISASVIIEITDTRGKLLGTYTKAFPSDSKELIVSFLPSSKGYPIDSIVVVTSYYVVNDAKFKIESVERKCLRANLREESSGGNINNIGKGNGTTSGSGSTAVGGGTIFPSEVVPENKPSSTENSTTKLFNDIGNYKWASEAIEELYYAGIINGMEDGVFNPSGNVTREQFSKMVVQLFGISTPKSNTGFVDVKSDSWYAPYITAALQAGYIQGQSGEYFGVGESIMRQDMATILYRALGDQNKKAILDFIDNDNIAPYAQDAIAELVGLGVINGYEDGSFNPRGTATRAEAAKMIYGVYQYLNN